MIGAFAEITHLLDVNHVRESIKRNVPKTFVELNLTVFEKDECGKSLLESQAY